MSHHVLIVDDDEAIREALGEALADEGYDVASAVNGRDALDRLQQDTKLPCLIFLDLMMPVMDGWQFRMAQQRDPRLAGIPVVVITASGVAAVTIPATAILRKPLKLEAVMGAIERYC